MKNNGLLGKIKHLNQSFLKPEDKDLAISEGIRAIAEATLSAVLVLDREGVVLNSFLPEDWTDQKIEKIISAGALDEDSALQRLIKSKETLFNEPEPGGKSNYCYIAVPISGRNKRLATLILGRSSGPFSDDELVLSEIGTALLSLMMVQLKVEKEEKNSRNKALAEGAFESLSYSEVEAIREILKNINNNESVVVASKIADNLGITRSVIVNALRKFESAGIIESRSLGMKGTFIRVKNLHALEIVASRSAKMSPY
jgi:transcriptional pleiotropic repressor